MNRRHSPAVADKKIRKYLLRCEGKKIWREKFLDEGFMNIDTETGTKGAGLAQSV
jgi:hypothetical protein